MFFEILIDAVMPLAILVLIGYSLRWAGILKNAWIKVLNHFVYFVSLPALIITSFARLELTENNMQAILWNIGLLIVFGAALFGCLQLTKIRPKQKTSIFIASMLGNTLYLGVPIYNSYLDRVDSTSVAIASAMLITGLALSMLVIEFWVVRSKNPSSYVLDLVKNPLIISIFIGLGANYFVSADRFPESLDTAISALAATASPLALIALGAFIFGKFSMKHISYSIFSAALKLVALPLLAWFAFSNSGLSKDVIDVSIIASSMPVAVTAFVLANKYNLDDAEIANTLLLSTVVSFLSIPAVIAFLA